MQRRNGITMYGFTSREEMESLVSSIDWFCDVTLVVDLAAVYLAFLGPVCLSDLVL